MAGSTATLYSSSTMTFLINFENPAHVAVMLLCFILWTAVVSISQEHGDEGIFMVPTLFAIIGLIACCGILIFRSL